MVRKQPQIGFEKYAIFFRFIFWAFPFWQSEGDPIALGIAGVVNLRIDASGFRV
jgi:hypothetical protein